MVVSGLKNRPTQAYLLNAVDKNPLTIVPQENGWVVLAGENKITEPFTVIVLETEKVTLTPDEKSRAAGR